MSEIYLETARSIERYCERREEISLSLSLSLIKLTQSHADARVMNDVRAMTPARYLEGLVAEIRETRRDFSECAYHEHPARASRQISFP